MTGMRRRRLLRGVGAATLLVVAGFGLLVWIMTPTPGVTWDNFHRLRLGMTEKDVSAILGAPSKTFEEKNRDGSKFIFSRYWRGEEVNISLVFSPQGQLIMGGSAVPSDLAMKLTKANEDWKLACKEAERDINRLTLTYLRLQSEWASVSRQTQWLRKDESLLDRIRRWLGRRR
jgi:hypothetical protein